MAKVTASGTLSALVTVQVGSQVSGRIKEINVDFNSPVKKGEVLAKIDPALFQAAVEQAKANLIAAEGNLEKSKAQAADAERQLARSKQLREQNLIAQADLDTAQATAEAAEAQVKVSQGQLAQSRASLDSAQTNLDYTTVLSPINGTVISRNVDVGQTVAAALSAPTLFTIAEDLSKMQVDTSVAEADVGKLSAGMRVSFFVDAFPTRKFDGTVRQIRNASTTVQNVVTYDAVVDVENSELLLRPGMTATVTFVYAEKDSALLVSNSALRFHMPGASGGGGGGRGANVAQGGGASAPGGTAGGGGSRGGGAAGGALASNDHRGKGDTRADAVPSMGVSSNGAAAAAGGGRKHDHAPDEREVFVLANGTPRSTWIRTGASDGTSTEVLSGDLNEGDAVVIGMTGGSSASGQQPGGMGMRRMF